MQSNHKENSIWRHDVKDVENVMQPIRRIACGEQHMENVMHTMRKIAYGDMMSSMWRMPCKPYGE